GVVADRLDPHRGAVRADLGPATGDLAVVEAERDDRVGPSLLRLVDHPTHRLVAALQQQLGHLRNLTATDRPEAGREPGPDVACAHRHPEDLSEDRAHLISSNVIRGDHQHPPIVWVAGEGETALATRT